MCKNIWLEFSQMGRIVYLEDFNQWSNQCLDSLISNTYDITFWYKLCIKIEELLQNYTRSKNVCKLAQWTASPIRNERSAILCTFKCQN